MRSVVGASSDALGDFWLCLAESNAWGGTIVRPTARPSDADRSQPELLFWYRANDEALRQSRWADLFTSGSSDMKARIQEKHRDIIDVNGGIPDVQTPRSVPFEEVSYEPPVDNYVGSKTSRAIMILLPWVSTGGAECVAIPIAALIVSIGALRFVETFARAGWRVTVVCTLYHPPDSIALRPRFMPFTHDFHVLPAFLRARHFPGFIKYLIDSRGIDTVLCAGPIPDPADRAA